jgi:predicted  nucleic acid-binding Zn-ribbon protein
MLLQWFHDRPHLLKNLVKASGMQAVLYTELRSIQNSKDELNVKLSKANVDLESIQARIRTCEETLADIGRKEASVLEQIQLLREYGKPEKDPRSAIFAAIFVELWHMDQDEIDSFRKDAPPELHELIDAFCIQFGIDSP